MSLTAGLAAIDITPPLGTHKVGWLKVIVSDQVLDPLFARCAVFQSDGEAIAFVQLDTLSVRAEDVAEMRRRIADRHDFPGGRVMISATHNHAGPAVISAGDVRRDAAYTESMMEKVVSAFGEALANRREAELGFGSVFEFNVAFNRRTVMRDGTVKTQCGFDDPMALYVEGPVDPEVAVLAVRSVGGEPLGLLVNFACHPTHHGGGGALSAGFPGALAREMAGRGWPVTMFLNGAAGNIIYQDYGRRTPPPGMERIGATLAGDVDRALEGMQYRKAVRLGSASRVIELPFRQITEDQVKGTARGAQRFIDSAIYERMMPELVERVRTRKAQPAEVQMHFMDEYAFAAVAAEYFVENGLRIKEQAYPTHALVVEAANGMVGYVPHRAAFERGGYETTFGSHSCLAPEAGDLLADAAVDLIRRHAAACGSACHMPR